MFTVALDADAAADEVVRWREAAVFHLYELWSRFEELDDNAFCGPNTVSNIVGNGILFKSYH